MTPLFFQLGLSMTLISRNFFFSFSVEYAEILLILKVSSTESKDTMRVAFFKNTYSFVTIKD